MKRPGGSLVSYGGAVCYQLIVVVEIEEKEMSEMLIDLHLLIETIQVNEGIC